MADPSDILAVEIHAADIETLRELVGTHPYDFGCRPHVFPVRDGMYMTPAFVTHDQFSQLQNENFDVQVKEQGIPVERRSESTVGIGDRFKGGNIIPRGMGTRGVLNEDLDVGRIMNADEIASAMITLVREYGCGEGGDGPTADGNKVMNSTAGVFEEGNEGGMSFSPPASTPANGAVRML